MDERLLRKNFFELKRFLDACLGMNVYIEYEDEKLLASDHYVLLEIADRLSFLLDHPGLGNEMPTFNPWTPPTTENTMFLKKFHALESRRYQQYLKEIEEYNELLNELRGQFGSGRKIMTEIYARIEEKSKDELNKSAIKLPWKLLPASTEERFTQIVSHYKILEQSNPHIKYDLDRLNLVFKLNADEIYIGSDEFEGYVVFYFNDIKSAVLECPIHGNAIYIFQKHWLTLSKLTKAALLGLKNCNIQRIIHNGSWYSRLEWLIYSRRKRSFPAPD